MLAGVDGALFPRLPAAFRTGLSVEEAIRQLASGVSPIGRSPRTSVVGEVSAGRVFLIRASRAGTGDAFVTCFVGAFDSSDGRTTLRGYYGLNPTTEAFVRSWFVVISGFTVLATIVVAAQWFALHDPTMFVIPAGAAAIGVFGYPLCRSVAGRPKGEQWFLDTFIRDSLRVVS